MSRTITDGYPYYCVTCGAGWNEYGFCESLDCRLEPAEEALKRSAPDLPPTPVIGNYISIMQEKL